MLSHHSKSSLQVNILSTISNSPFLLYCSSTLSSTWFDWWLFVINTKNRTRKGSDYCGDVSYETRRRVSWVDYICHWWWSDQFLLLSSWWHCRLCHFIKSVQFWACLASGLSIVYVVVLILSTSVSSSVFTSCFLLFNSQPWRYQSCNLSILAWHLQ